MPAPNNPPRETALLVLRTAALVGMCLAGYLLYLAMTGAGVPGCGEGAGGCGEVLTSRWSKLLGMPVSIFAFAAYMVVLAASIHAGAARPELQRRGAWRLIGFVGVAAGLSALWFIGVQLLILESVCYVCMAAHACSLVIAGVALRRSRGITAWLGALPAAALIGLQLSASPQLPAPDDSAVYLGNFDPQAPVLGDPDAPHQAALLFDYHCAFCRHLHALLIDAIDRSDGQLSIVMLPTALDPQCNPGAQTPGPHSALSCEFARLSLAVWFADPADYAGFDRWLIEHAATSPSRLSDAERAGHLAQAQAHAAALVGEAALDGAMDDPRIDRLLKSNGQVYRLATYQGRRGVPRLILAGRPYPALADQASVDRALQNAYPGLTLADANESADPADEDRNDQ